jgi:hypothetical protein
MANLFLQCMGTGHISRLCKHQGHDRLVFVTYGPWHLLWRIIWNLGHIADWKLEDDEGNKDQYKEPESKRIRDLLDFQYLAIPNLLGPYDTASRKYKAN